MSASFPQNTQVFAKEDLQVEGPYLYSPVVQASKPQNRWVPSWNLLPTSCEVTISMRWGNEMGWTGWKRKFVVGPNEAWSIASAEQHEADEPTCLQSVPAPIRCQLRLHLPGHADIRTLALTHYQEGEKREFDCEPSEAWGFEHEVPTFSQLNEDGRIGCYPYSKDGRVGNLICSPTSLAMVYSIWGWWGYHIPPVTVAQRTYDRTTQLYGVWALNAGSAYPLVGTECYVASLSTISQLEEEVLQGVPPVASIAWEEGQLNNASQSSSKGHLVAVIGFTQQGDVVVNDPNVTQEMAVRRVLRRDEFFAAWQRRSGATYIFRWPQVGLGYLHE